MVPSRCWERGWPRRGSLRRWHLGWVLMSENDLLFWGEAKSVFLAELSRSKGREGGPRLASSGNWRVSVARKRSVKELGESSRRFHFKCEWKLLEDSEHESDMIWWTFRKDGSGSCVKSGLHSRDGSTETWEEATAESRELGSIKWDGTTLYIIFNVV